MVIAQTQTLVDRLRRRVRTAPSQPAFRYLEDDGDGGPDLTVADLDRAARAVAASLSDIAPGERALLLYPPGPDFAAAFLGCLYARIIAVPLPLSNPHRLKRQAARIARDCAAALILTNDASAAALARALDGAPTPAIRTAGQRPTAAGDAWDGALPTMGDPAFIQYTSGTTGGPKGVLVKHASLAANIAAIKVAFRITPADVAVTWLPHHHDMGLIGILATAIMIGHRVVLLSPLDMLRQPIRWLRAITRFGATITGSPPFGYERCLSRILPEQRSGLDLSACRLAFVGAEPIRAGLLAQFCETYRPFGFRSEAFYPCYGLAEATLFATGGTAGSGFKRARSAPDTVSCGKPAKGHQLIIVDPVTRRPVPTGEEGEIWLSGPSVAAGYWGREEETDTVFRATLSEGGHSRFLRTGDLGRQEAGALVITGRLKDVIIVAGRNHHAEDLELSAQAACPELRAGGVAAFAIARTEGEALVLAIEGQESDGLRARLREALAAEHDLAITDMLFVSAGRLPRTTSGKISRKACQTLYLERRRVRNSTGDEAGAA
jgi:phthiocerol/phenolphthiocerol synthesis type-I polyketide synthase C